MTRAHNLPGTFEANYRFFKKKQDTNGSPPPDQCEAFYINP